MENVNYTIGWLQTVREKNGASINNFNVTEAYEVANKAKSKTELPALYVYRGTKGVYSPSNVFFMDIDTIDGVENIIENCDELFTKIPFIYAVQKSHSGKLHIIGTHNESYPDEQSWKYATVLLSLAVCKKITSLFGVDYIKSSALDVHQVKFSQGLFFSKEPFIINEFATPCTISSSDEQKITKEYPEFFKEFRSEYGNKNQASIKDVDIDFGAVAGKLLINKDFRVGQYSGNDLRWRIGSYLVCTYGEEQARKIVGRLFVNPGEFSFYDKGVNLRVKNWFENTFPFIQTPAITKQEENRITKIEMSDEEWMSDYVDIIENYISKEQILTISAPTGTGKTTMLKSITEKYHKNAVILTPFNVTNNLYRWSNIVCSSDDTSKYKRGAVNTMIWDQFVKNYKEIEQGSNIIFVDESHALFFDQTYRDKGIDVWGRFETWVQLGKKVVFVSATPAGEIAKLNSRVLKFTKKDHRDVKINIIHVNDTFTALVRDCDSREYDKVCVFSDRDVGMLWGGIYSDGRWVSDAYKIYHGKWEKNIEVLKEKEELTARVNLFTCIAFNGLNFRNKNEKILISIRYTRNETTVNEIIQILGRFRNNKDITLNIYDDGKYVSNIDFDELFEDAETITSCEDVSILKSEYYERLSKIPVQDAMREVKAYKSVWALRRVVQVLGSMYPMNIVERTEEFKEGQIVKRGNKLKKQASDLMASWLMGEINDQEFHDAYVKTDMKIFIDAWVREWMSLKLRVGEESRLVDIVLEELKKPNRQVEGVIREIKLTVKVVSMAEEQWKVEVESWETLKELIKGKNTSKWAMAQFRKCTKIREKYAEFINDGSVKEECYDMGGLFGEMLSEVKTGVQETMKKRSKARKKPRKKQLFKSVETGEMKTKKEWMKVLGCNENKFNDLYRRKGLYIKVL